MVERFESEYFNGKVVVFFQLVIPIVLVVITIVLIIMHLVKLFILNSLLDLTNHSVLSFVGQLSLNSATSQEHSFDFKFKVFPLYLVISILLVV